MPTDFYDAFHRHRQDGEILYERQRWANADHLYGLSAECGLKALMLKLGMPVSPAGVPQGPYRIHIDRLWTSFRIFASGKLPPYYFSFLSSNNPFRNWDIGQRYENQSGFNQATVDPHRQEVQKIKQMLDKAKSDGIL